MRTFQLTWVAYLASFLLLVQVVSGEEAEQLPFRDIEHHWAKAEILDTYTQGLMLGLGAEFQPDRPITIGEFLQVVDRLILFNEWQLYPLSLLHEYDETGWGEGFDEPYLPYRDVDRLTAMYPSILRVWLFYDRLYGPEQFHRLFPGTTLNLDQPIGQEQAGQILQMFGLDQKNPPWSEWQWRREPSDSTLTRAEMAVLVANMQKYLDTQPLLTVLSVNNDKFPLVPNVPDLFPLFADYYDWQSDAGYEFYQLATAISRYEDDAETYKRLKQLAKSSFPNQVGVHYYLSWQPDTPLKENWQQALLALDAYFAAGQELPETLMLLAANVYDLALELQVENSEMIVETLEQLQTYEQLTTKGTAEWETLSHFIAALQIQNGEYAAAIQRYKELRHLHEGISNAVFYLLQTNDQQQAKELLAEAIEQQDDPVERAYLAALYHELEMMEQQPAYVKQLETALQTFEQSGSYEASGEAMLNEIKLKYIDRYDFQRKVGQTTGIMRQPHKYVAEKVMLYTDDEEQLVYRFDFDQRTWYKEAQGEQTFLHDWVSRLTPTERWQKLNARYVSHTSADYEVITEWIPFEAMRQYTAKQKLAIAPLEAVPVFATKYYIDRNTGQLAGLLWHYEEMYQTGDVVTFVGRETYHPLLESELSIPVEVREGAIAK